MRLRRGPHTLHYLHAWVDCGIPKKRKDDMFGRVEEVVVACRNVRTKDLDMLEGLLDWYFRILCDISLTPLLVTRKRVTYTSHRQAISKGKVNFLPTASVSLIGSFRSEIGNNAFTASTTVAWDVFSSFVAEIAVNKGYFSLLERAEISLY
jgi:hypothetical protein